MRMVVAGGGTGGHLFPGLAVAECVAASGDGEVAFIGGSDGIEARVIPNTRFQFHALTIHGLRGRGLRGLFELAIQLPVALIRAWQLLGELRTQVVVGVGGYASFPVVAAAWLRRVPSVLLEQNATPGMANRVLSRFAKRVCTNFEEAGRFFPAGKMVRTGNPVRQLNAPPRDSSDGFSILVFGGSQGARRINDAMFEAAPVLRDRIAGLRVTHQTGSSDVDRLRARYAELSISAQVHTFIDDMGAAYGDADLVVCRAGATTVAEVSNLAKAAIMIPYPFAADDHQRANAEVLAKQGAGILVLDRELTGERLSSEVLALAENRQRLRAIGEAALRLAMPDAATRVVEVCREVTGEGRAHV